MNDLGELGRMGHVSHGGRACIAAHAAPADPALAFALPRASIYTRSATRSTPMSAALRGPRAQRLRIPAAALSGIFCP